MNETLATNTMGERDHLRDGQPRTCWHYRVVDPAGREAPRGCANGLPIGYTPDGGLLTRVCDPLGAVNQGSVELLLGWSYIDLGLFRVGTSSYFLLEREGPLQHVASTPG